MNNDFHDSRTIFELFKGLELDWDALATPFSADTQVNGNHTSEPVLNGATNGTNGHAQPLAA